MLAQEPTLALKPTKTAVSFYKPTRDGRVFLCYFNATGGRDSAYISFRSDTVEPYVDLPARLHALPPELASRVEIREGKMWNTIHLPFQQDLVRDLARFIAREIAAHIE